MSRPCSTGPEKMPPLIVLPRRWAPLRPSRTWVRRGEGYGCPAGSRRSKPLKVAALQHRPWKVPPLTVFVTSRRCRSGWPAPTRPPVPAGTRCRRRRGRPALRHGQSPSLIGRRLLQRHQLGEPLGRATVLSPGACAWRNGRRTSALTPAHSWVPSARQLHHDRASTARSSPDPYRPPSPVRAQFSPDRKPPHVGCPLAAAAMAQAHTGHRACSSLAHHLAHEQGSHQTRQKPNDKARPPANTSVSAGPSKG